MIDYTPLKITLFTKDMSMKELSLKLCNNQDIIWRYTNGLMTPSLATLDKITDVLECEIEDVVRYKHEVDVEDSVKKYEEELEMRFLSPPDNLDDFIMLMTESFRRGLESK